MGPPDGSLDAGVGASGEQLIDRRETGQRSMPGNLHLNHRSFSVDPQLADYARPSFLIRPAPCWIA